MKLWKCAIIQYPTANIQFAPPSLDIYYRLCSGTDVKDLAPGKATLSDGSPLELTLDSKGTCTFYQLEVSTR